MKIINDAIRDEYIKYAHPVYQLKYMSTETFPDINLTVESEIFSETMLLRLRGETIKYASATKRKANNLEIKLKLEIETLEAENDVSKFEILKTKKMELEGIRTERMKGQWVR